MYQHVYKLLSFYMLTYTFFLVLHSLTNQMVDEKVTLETDQLVWGFLIVVYISRSWWGFFF